MEKKDDNDLRGQPQEGSRGGVIRRLRGQVVDHFFSPRQVVDHFFALRQGQALASSVFLIEYIFFKDLRGIRRDPKTARRTTTSPAVGRLGLPGLSAGSAGVSG